MGKILKPQRSSKTLLPYVRKVKVSFSLDVNRNSPISSDAIPTLYEEYNHATCTGDPGLVTSKSDRNVEIDHISAT